MEDLIIKYFTNTVDACAVKHLTTDEVLSDKYSDTLNDVAETLAVRVPEEIKKVIKLNRLNEKVKSGNKLTFDEELFVQQNMKLVQFLDAEDLARGAHRSFYNENGYIKY